MFYLGSFKKEIDRISAVWNLDSSNLHAVNFLSTKSIFHKFKAKSSPDTAKIRYTAL
jgi:hypothetical protein